MADGQGDGSIAPRRSLGGPILPPPPPEMAQKAREAEEKKAAHDRAAAQRQAEKEARQAEREAKRNAAARQRADAKKAADARREQETAKAAEAKREQDAREKAARDAEETKRREAAERQRAREAARAASPVAVAPSTVAKKTTSSTSTKGRSVRRTRRAQLRLVQVDAWSVMKTSFLLSIALGIVLVVAVAIIWSVLGAAGVWDSINSIVQQAVGTDNGQQFDIQQYLGASRVLGFTMIVAVLDVILITAIATLGAFLYNLSAALLGGIEVTLAEDS